MTIVVRVLALSALLVTACTSPVPPSQYQKAVVGTWLFSSKWHGSRIIVFHADGAWGVRKFDDDRPEYIRGRRWRVEGSNLILRYPADHGFTTAAYQILSFTSRKFVTEVHGYKNEYKRIEYAALHA